VFGRILIANRGEIALRVLRACRGLGVESVLAYSEADRKAPWIDEADQAICVGPAAASASYLNQAAMLQAAEQTDCHALHPGYGFLAENASFAARCEQQGLVFVGPTPRTIRRMGDKVEAKRTMAQEGLITIPGSDGIVADAEQAGSVGQRIGFPVLLKACAGGGGKGMRLCSAAKHLGQAFTEASAEAGSAFGDSSLYVEKVIEGGRHVEFQVLADTYGAVVHLGERECSIQRQHQKLVEESPSPVVEARERQDLGCRVVRAMQAIGYRNAGTVEFLRAPDGQFYFMEMNTRLQVEHPVTEQLTGVDIVVEQLKIAANQRLGLDQEQVRFDGHVIELRVNAEDPQRGFRPDPGTIEVYQPPCVEGDGFSVRWDSAIRQGYRIPPHYDSLIGKLIVRGDNRALALEGARRALSSMRIDGVRTTIELHLRLLQDPEFCAGQYDIDFLQRSDLLQVDPSRA
jgi:acetyl-CoA carboxylase biotin carboxylase subunit